MISLALSIQDRILHVSPLLIASGVDRGVIEYWLEEVALTVGRALGSELGSDPIPEPWLDQYAAIKLRLGQMVFIVTG